MWKQVFDFGGKLWGLLEDTQQNKTEIKELRRELRDLTTEVRLLAYEIRRVSEREAQARETLLLQVENQILRFERRLPAPGRSKD